MEVQDYSNYLIYDNGVVFSKKRNKFMKPQKNQLGYERILLSKNGKQKRFSIHRLVALHYIPKIEGKNVVDHIDGNKLNNNVNNLRWTTIIENCNNYQKLRKNNTSGFKNISEYNWKYFKFEKRIHNKNYRIYHNNLNELLWYKFVFLIINNS